MMFRNTRFYRELRYFYNAAFVYKKPFFYLYNRFWIGRCLRYSQEPLGRSHDADYSVHLLCGRWDLDLLLWSLKSWHDTVPNSGKVFIHEDGSFRDEDKRLMAKLFPDAKIISLNESNIRITGWLGSYPETLKYRSRVLTDKRHIYGVKLIDPFFISDKDKVLIIDSDLLWFQKPSELVEALHKSAGSLFMKGTAPMDFQFRDGSRLSGDVGLVNSGVVLFEKQDFDWQILERFLSRVGENANPHFIEQAGYAYVLGRKGVNFLPEDKYHIKGRVNEDTVMKHYTGPRREEFWFEGVKLLKGKILK